MAGSEKTGIEVADSKLFQKSVCILTPTRRTSPRALGKVSALWRSVGARVLKRSPEKHDTLVAQVSHVPHLTAVGLIQVTSSGAVEIAGPGFRDATRVAASDPELWGEICHANAPSISRAIGDLIDELRLFQNSLKNNKISILRNALKSAQRKRLGLKS